MPVVDRTATILDIFAGARPHAPRASSRSSSPSSSTTSPACAGCGRTSSASAASPAAASRRAARASRRSRPTAAWRATASPRCAAGSSDVKGTRATMRAERERAHLPQIALAGYTNAGKSTLLNALTGADVGVRDRLFHTLDPTTRSLRIDGRPYLLTDTVGFIRKLPHQLVDAFGATLEETRLADLDPARRRRLGADEDELRRDAARRRRRRSRRSAPASTPRLLVLNKADALDADAPRRAAPPPPRRRAGLARSTGEGLDELARPHRAGVRAHAAATSSCCCPTPRAAGWPSCTTSPATSSATDTADGVRVRAPRPAAVAERYARFAVDRRRAGGRDGTARRRVDAAASAACTRRGAAGARPRRRRRPRPARASRPSTLAPGERAHGPHRHRGRAPRRPRRPGPAALGPGGAPRHRARQRARPDRRRATAASCRCCC